MPTAFTVSMLAWGLLAFPGSYAKSGNTAPALASVRWGSDYLLKAFHKDAKKGYLLVYQALLLLLPSVPCAQPEKAVAASTPRLLHACVPQSDSAQDPGRKMDRFGLLRKHVLQCPLCSSRSAVLGRLCPHDGL